MRYDSTGIPAVYDAGRSLSAEVVARWMDTVAARCAGSPITVGVDLGCGTGRFAAPLAATFDARVIGIDPSRQMLARAAAKEGDRRVRFVAGGGEAMPLPHGSVDLVFSSMAYHHFSDPRTVARECRRILRPGGLVVIRTGTRDRMHTYPYVAFFPAAVPLLEDRLPTVDRIQETFTAAGFRPGSQELIAQEVAPNLTDYSERIALRADSVLAALDTAAFEEGLSALRAEARAAPPRPVVELIDFLVFR